jgi:hypothetical protein
LVRFGSFLNSSRGRPNGWLFMRLLSTQDEGHLESIVYFLSEALRAAIEAGDSLQQCGCGMPQLDQSMDCGEITERLASFRHYIQALWSREVMMMAKILRARELAKELRIHDAELRPEIDTFRLATVSSADIQDMLLPDAQNLFNGAVEPRRFIEARGWSSMTDVSSGEPLLGYRVAGHVDVRLLLDACEALHFGLAARYGFDSLRSRAGGETEEAMLLDEVVEAPMLLTELGDIVSEGPAIVPFDWRSIFPIQPAVRH